MGFSNDINKFVKKAKENLNKEINKHEELAKTRLIEVMGEDLNAITSITFNLEKGKFINVEAPEYAKNKLREADLIIE